MFRLIKYTLAIFLVFTGILEAQENKDIKPSTEYKNAIGIRAGRTSGLTFKHFFNSGNAFEGIIGLWNNAVGITALYEKNQGTGVSGLKFYYGGGAHVTRETGRYYYRRHNGSYDEYTYRYGENGWGAGIDGIVGLDFKFAPIPLAISFDIKPFVELSNYGYIYTGLDAGLGIKLAF